MKNLKFIIIIFFLNFNLFAKVNTIDYSYLLFRFIDENNINQGTGFFLKKNNILYLVTAAHNFHTDKTSKIKTAEDFYLRMPKSDNSFDMIRIENNPINKKDIEYQNLDVNFYKVDIPESYNVNIINIEEKRNFEVKTLISYGYSVVDDNSDNLQKYINEIRPTEFQSSIFGSYENPIRYDDGTIDFNNFAGIFISTTLGKGSSGSPVFSKTISNGKEVFEFVGLLHTGNLIYKEVTILRKAVIKEIFDKI